MNIFKFFKEQIHYVVTKNYPVEISISNILTEYPNNPKYGDISTNIAILVARQINDDLAAVAKKLAAEICNNRFVLSAEFTHNGFINLTLTQELWSVFLEELLNQGSDYPIFSIQKKTKINVEFVSANPTGPLHIGHAKSAVIGDVIANLLSKFGYDVTKEYYINDAGGQINKLAESLEIRYKQEHGEDVEVPEGHYPGEYLVVIAKKIINKHIKELNRLDNETRESFFKKFAVKEILALIKKDLADLGIEHNIFVSEKDIIQTGSIKNLINILATKGLIYNGILKKPKGGTNITDWEAKKQLIFKATKFGDDADRTILKSTGDPTYFATDMAYHADKINRGFQQMILFLGADHIGYTKRIKSAVKALSNNKASLEVKICQLVKLRKDGQIFKMSKRSGNFISLRELLDTVGADALRFAILQKSADTIIEFNVDKLQEQNKNNPIFYVQYASARTHSIMRKKKENKILNCKEDKTKDFYELLTEPHEIHLIKHLALYPKIIESCVKTLDPHKITYYLYDLACLFHQSWNIGNLDTDSKFIIEANLPLTKARLALIEAISIVLNSGLKLLGIKSLQRM